MRRTFVALEGTAPTVDAWERLGAAARATPEAEALTHGNRRPWVQREDLHVTLAFLGTTEEERVAAVVAALGAIERPVSLEAPVVGLTGFPSVERGRVLTLELALTGALAALQRAIAAAVEGLGFELEARSYRPHVTLGRFASTDLGPLVQAVPAPTEPARLASITFFDSNTRSEGAHYTPIARFPFGAP